MELIHEREWHSLRGAVFGDVNGAEVVMGYGDSGIERRHLRDTVGLTELSFRGRLCLIGPDRQRFLHGQVTNDVMRLEPGRGCYAALVSAKGKIQSDLNIYNLGDELLLDFEPGLTETVKARLNQYLIADDVEIVEVGPVYGMWSVHGPKARTVMEGLGSDWAIPVKPFHSVRIRVEPFGRTSAGESVVSEVEEVVETGPWEIYLMNQPRLGKEGFDLYAPAEAMGALADRLLARVQEAGGGLAGWEAWERVRIEAGIPRFGVDMSELNLAPEAGLNERAINYNKGCYIGQEVIARIRTYGQVAKALRRLEIQAPEPPPAGAKIFHVEKEMGWVTSVTKDSKGDGYVGLGYVRREVNAIGTELEARWDDQKARVRILGMPFEP